VRVQALLPTSLSPSPSPSPSHVVTLSLTRPPSVSVSPPDRIMPSPQTPRHLEGVRRRRVVRLWHRQVDGVPAAAQDIRLGRVKVRVVGDEAAGAGGDQDREQHVLGGAALVGFVIGRAGGFGLAGFECGRVLLSAGQNASGCQHPARRRPNEKVHQSAHLVLRQHVPVAHEVLHHLLQDEKAAAAWVGLNTRDMTNWLVPTPGGPEPLTE
jgi:hypothetical protein